MYVPGGRPVLESIAPSEGSWFIFLLCRLEGRPIFRLTFETPGYYAGTLYTSVCAPPYAIGPTETSYVDPFSGPVDPYTRVPDTIRRGEEGRERGRKRAFYLFSNRI